MIEDKQRKNVVFNFTPVGIKFLNTIFIQSYPEKNETVKSEDDLKLET